MVKWGGLYVAISGVRVTWRTVVMKWGGLYVAISGGVSYLEGCGDEVGWFVRCHIRGCELPGGLW